MHALPSHPKHPILFGALALLFVLFVLAATAPDLGTLDFSLSGGGTAPVTEAAPATSAQPTWVHDPLAPPLTGLAR